MSSTRLRTLLDLFPGLRGGTTRKLDAPGCPVEHVQTRTLNAISATTTVGIAAFQAKVRILSVSLVPDASVATNGTNYWTFQVAEVNGPTNEGSSVTTNTGGTALTADTETILWQPTTPTYISAADSLKLTLTVTGAPSALSGLVIVRYLVTF